MDRQEAIKGLKNLFSEHELSLPNTDSLEILNMAIAALEKEDAEEQGLLIKLPCKVGDKVYIPGHQFPSEIWEISINGDGVFANYVEYEYSPELTELWDDGDFAIKDIGKTVFLTREEAERALERKKHD